MQNTVEIRLELLKSQGIGLTKRETVKRLQDRFGITEQGAYYHFQTLDKWISQYLDFKNIKAFQFNILNQLNTINREASFQYMQAKDPNSKIGFMRTRLTALCKMAEYAGLTNSESEAVTDYAQDHLKEMEDSLNRHARALKLLTQEERLFVEKAEMLLCKKLCIVVNEEDKGVRIH